MQEDDSWDAATNPDEPPRVAINRAGEDVRIRMQMRGALDCETVRRCNWSSRQSRRRFCILWSRPTCGFSRGKSCISSPVWR